MRFIFTLTIVLLALLAGAFYYIFYTPALVLKVAPAFVEKYLPDATLSSLSIGSQSFSYPEILKLYNIKAQVERQDETYQIEISELDFLNFQKFLRAQQQVQIELTGLNFHQARLEILNAALGLSVNLDAQTFRDADIILRDGELKRGAYTLTNAQAYIQVSKEKLKISELKVTTYGGETKGNIDVSYPPHSKETISMEFKNIKSSELTAINKTLFSQLDGQFAGTMRLTRIDGLIQVFVINSEMPQGTTIKSALSKKIISYMTNEDSRDKATNYLENKAQLEFDQAEFRVLNVNQNLVAFTFTLNNKKDDLHIHETINIDIARILKKAAWGQ